MATVIADDDARARLTDLPGWAVVDRTLVREFKFKGFPEAVAFVTRLVRPKPRTIIPTS